MTCLDDSYHFYLMTCLDTHIIFTCLVPVILSACLCVRSHASERRFWSMNCLELPL